MRDAGNGSEVNGQLRVADGVALAMRRTIVARDVYDWWSKCLHVCVKWLE